MPVGDIEVSQFMPMESSGTPSIGDLTGPAALEAMDKSTRGQVQAYIDGRSIPVGNARSPGVQYIKRLAAQVEPGFDEARFKERQGMMTDYAGGTTRRNIIDPLKQAVSHMHTLAGAYDKMENTSLPAYNYVKNTLNTWAGNPEQKGHDVAADAVARELSKVFKGANLSDSEIREWRTTLSNANSPAQARAVLGQAIDLLNGRLQATSSSYERVMGKPIQLLDPHAMEALQKVRAWADGAKLEPMHAPALGTVAAPGAPAAQPGMPQQAAPQPGVQQPAAAAPGAPQQPAAAPAPPPGNYVYDPTSRKLVPAQ